MEYFPFLLLSEPECKQAVNNEQMRTHSERGYYCIITNHPKGCGHINSKLIQLGENAREQSITSSVLGDFMITRGNLDQKLLIIPTN